MFKKSITNIIIINGNVVITNRKTTSMIILDLDYLRSALTD